MARASSICIATGCYEYAIGDGRCQAHALTHGWGSSTRRKPKGWEITRRRVLRRDHYCCYLCGKRTNIVDHLVAQQFGGDENQSNLRAMCGQHHRAKTNDEAALGRAMAKAPRANRPALIAELVERWR